MNPAGTPARSLPAGAGIAVGLLCAPMEKIMDARRAERNLETAKSAMRLAEGNFNHAEKDWFEAKDARGDNRLWYRLTRRHGHGVFREREDYFRRARKEYDDARERLEKAEADYRKVTGKEPD